jgi:hypothetical protein
MPMNKDKQKNKAREFLQEAAWTLAELALHRLVAARHPQLTIPAAPRWERRDPVDLPAATVREFVVHLPGGFQRVRVWMQAEEDVSLPTPLEMAEWVAVETPDEAVELAIRGLQDASYGCPELEVPQ